MGASVEHLQKDPKTGRLSFRRAFPPELRPHIAGQPRELKRSLAAKNIAEPGALDRFKQAAADYERLTAQARKAASRTFDSLDGPTIAYLAKVFERDLHEGDERAVQEGRAEQALAGWRWMLDEYRQWRVERDLDEMEAHWGRSAMGLLSHRGLVLDPADRDGFRRLCAALNDTAIAVSEVAKARLAGQIVPIPDEPPPPETAVQVPSAAALGASYGQIAESLLENPRLRIGAATKQASRTALRFLREAIGDLPPRAIERRLVAQFLDLLAQRPAKLPKAERGLPLRAVVNRYQDRDGVPRLAAKTLEQHLGSLSTLWVKAQDRGDVPDGLPNPFKHKLTPAPPRDNPTGLTRQELQAIFRLPVFTKGERPGGGKGEASYWLPLLLLWTGARPEELAQLMVGDVAQDEETGRWLLRITDEGTHPHKGKRSLKTAKTLSGRRTFPIPRPLLEFGFLEYVTAVREAGETALFPKLRTKGERGLLFAGFSEWWSGYLREHGVALAPGKRPAREFRHTWTTAARASGLPREAMEYIQGHRAAGGSAHEVYGSREPLGWRIDDLRFDGLDLSAVRGWRAR
jgi:integrase